MPENNLQISLIKSGELSDRHTLLQVKRMIAKHARRAMQLLSIQHPLTITVYPKASWCIPETGDTGYTPTADWMQISLDLTGNVHPVETIISHRIPPTVYHEMNHVKRWVTTGFGTTFRENLVTEGLAAAFEIDQVEHDIHPFFDVPKEEIDELLRLVVEQKDRISNAYDYGEWFPRGSTSVPKWVGYKIGYYIIKEVLAHNPTQNVITLTNLSAEEVIRMSGVPLTL
jgi:hypothetical protein